MPTPQEIAMQNQANQNLQMQGKGNPMMPPVLNNSVQQIQQQRQQQIANQNRLQGRNAGELGGNWNQTFGTPQVGGIQNPNPSWNGPGSTPVPGSGSPIGGTGVIGGSQSGYNPPPTLSTLTGI